MLTNREKIKFRFMPLEALAEEWRKAAEAAKGPGPDSTSRDVRERDIRRLFRERLAEERREGLVAGGYSYRPQPGGPGILRDKLPEVFAGPMTEQEWRSELLDPSLERFASTHKTLWLRKFRGKKVSNAMIHHANAGVDLLMVIRDFPAGKRFYVNGLAVWHEGTTVECEVAMPNLAHVMTTG